jgi:hypothetical protein
MERMMPEQHPTIQRIAAIRRPNGQSSPTKVFPVQWRFQMANRLTV